MVAEQRQISWSGCWIFYMFDGRRYINELYVVYVIQSYILPLPHKLQNEDKHRHHVQQYACSHGS